MFVRTLSIAAILLALSSAAQAQGAMAPAWTAGGYNNAAALLAQSFSSPNAESNGNTVVINGEIQTPGMTSVVNQYSQLSGGAAYAGAGAGFATAAAVGNSLSIMVQGSGNTVIVTSVQSNTGAVTAAAVINSL